ncbi:long-chain fatty acid--CoA ligase [Haloarcula sp. H-GB4]|uniref:long-chain-fatty-acid--CoA ligase n=1 Tax=Haloarcula sp. H-GB4 TaxID=3069755 RepID=UPI0027ADF099|nr:long-chain fatty acid--CoA ligase [Haloarcula sp. H-GB4]MDQ2074507.1 long-chain fatty acid--CoA ligase [Haloarcula sp. H-GB4]
MTNLVTEVADTVSSTPDSVALSYDGTEQTYETFWERTGQFAAALNDRGIGEDDRIAIYLPNLPQFVTAFYGALRTGSIVVPMNPQYKAREISHLLSDSGSKAVVTLSENAEAVAEVQPETDVETVVSVGAPVESATDFEEFLADEMVPVVKRADDDVAVQPYSSGTTGQPKGVLLSHHNLASNTRSNTALLEPSINHEDNLIGTLPLFHIYGMSAVMNAAVFTGATYYPVAEWDPKVVFDLIESEAITVMYGVPAMFNDMINQPNADEVDLTSLRFVNSGGSSLPMEVLERFEELFEISLFEGYGLTETSPVTHANRPSARRKGSIGQPVENVDAKIVDQDFEEMPRVEEGPIDESEVDLDDVVGELVVAGPNVMQGYSGLPEANEHAFTHADGKRWFHTEDLGYWDEDNFVYIVDRENHMIITGGYNVYPREVEELLYEHDAVADAAVVGTNDDRRGETVKAFIVPAPGYEPGVDVPEEAIKQYTLDNLAEYKHPRIVEFRDELPRTTTGKVQKYELRNDS